VTIRAATPADGDALLAFFRDTAIAAGTSFAFDRVPDFFALLREQGESRTLMMHRGDRLVGMATVLWHPVQDGSQVARLAEVRDFRLASDARGGRAAYRLLAAVDDVLHEIAADWVVALISDANFAAFPMAEGRLGLSRLTPRTTYLSAHYMTWSPPRPRNPEWLVAEATPDDGDALLELLESNHAAARLAPLDRLPWPDPSGRTSAWLARDRHGRPIGCLMLWDGDALRRIRVMRYHWRDLPLRAISSVGGLLGGAVALPAPGGALRTWASRAFVATTGEPRLLRALLAEALRAGVRSGRHVVQLNLRSDDPIVSMLPRWPRSLHRSTIHAGPLTDRAGAGLTPTEHFHADIALA
jgi:hypothetical protein